MQDQDYELIDTHAHLAFEPLIDDLNAVLDRSRAAGVTKCITVGTKTEENRRSVEIAQKYDGLYATVGIHPHYAKDVTEPDITELEILSQNEKVVALGETGLDFHYNFSAQPAQIELFKKHLEVAAKVNLPVIIHSREAFNETLEILEPYSAKLKNVVFHCFTGTADQAELIIEKGWYISFTGVVTFKSANDVRESAKATPLERMMLETDCPYMTPAPMRKQKINEPALLVHTAKFIADLKGVTLEQLASKTVGNSLCFFAI